MKEQIEKIIKEVLKNLGITDEVSFSVEHPDDFNNGDYSTNVAMVCAKKVGLNPREFAEKIVSILRKTQDEFHIHEIQVAGPGFINFYLSREFFTESVEEILKQKENWGKNEILKGKKVMVEYTDPNPFKPFHIGHLMANAIGESISRIVEFSGANTIRANYQGDVGPHVAKAIYGLMKFGLPDGNLSIGDKAQYIGKCYSEGSNLYDTDENIKKEIDEINKKVYERSDVEINKIYDWGREITLLAFEDIYKILGTKFDHYFFESDMAKIGEKIVRLNVGKTVSTEDDRSIFEESNGAIIFHGENYDKKLHTRVFINSQGLPTYETKEIGLTMTKFKKKNIFDKSLDLSIVTTAIEQAEYMKVVQKAISLIDSKMEKKMKHITHGMMKLASGKMSSRKGNVITGESLLQDSMDMILEKMKDRDLGEGEKKKISEIVGVSALKYSILKSSLGSDIIYDQDKSISFDGDSGPYLQYTVVRASSIIKKAESFDLENKIDIPKEITELEKLLYQFPEIVKYSYEELEPHHITTYLTELASSFNSFYGNTQIVVEGNIYMAYHLNLVKSFYQTMKNGLWLLGIEIPERM
jgi:arginyl-tRNA synthetase